MCSWLANTMQQENRYIKIAIKFSENEASIPMFGNESNY